MGIYEKLSKIQQELKAPKNLFNSFGKYKYRNAEGILEAFKPFEAKYGVALILSDEVLEIGGRVYVKATASLFDIGGSGMITGTAYAREDAEKKGMDGSQITGTASSYARKYALNGLFLLDDTKDADTDEYQRQKDAAAEKQKEDGKLRASQKLRIVEEINRTGVSKKSLLTAYKVASIDELTEQNAEQALKKLEGMPDREVKK